MIKIVIIVASLLAAAPAVADDAKPLTVEQCINVLTGLTSLNFNGQQLNDPTRPPDAKQYKLGPARVKIALDISALTPVLTAAQAAQQGYLAELPALPATEPNKASPEHDAALAEQNKKAVANWQKLIKADCPVVPGHLNAADLKIGDGPDENQYPPNVLSAIAPIVDGLK